MLVKGDERDSLPVFLSLVRRHAPRLIASATQRERCTAPSRQESPFINGLQSSLVFLFLFLG